MSKSDILSNNNNASTDDNVILLRRKTPEEMATQLSCKVAMLEVVVNNLEKRVTAIEDARQ